MSGGVTWKALNNIDLERDIQFVKWSGEGFSLPWPDAIKTSENVAAEGGRDVEEGGVVGFVNRPLDIRTDIDIIEPYGEG